MDYSLHSDIVFKHADGVDIELDVYELPGETPTPAMLHLHGGALILGSKRMGPGLRDLFLGWGYALVSANYRLAPEARWPAFKDDVLDAHKWMLASAATYNIDPARVGVFGGSAGGYLSLLLGAHARPRPRVVVPFPGYGDVAGPWYSKPDPFYLTLEHEEWDEVRKCIGPTVLTECSDPLKGRFYRYCRQHGLWPKHVIGFHPSERPDIFDQACPERLVTPEYPPTFLIHGTADTDVPYACAESMYEALQGHGVESTLATMEGGPHGV
ncbi:MAG: alpha/beta hydrolase fold domain-containing protein, partial [Armatimonadota bacterium]